MLLNRLCYCCHSRSRKSCFTLFRIFKYATNLKEKEWEGVTCKELMHFFSNEGMGSGIHLSWFIVACKINASIWITLFNVPIIINKNIVRRFEGLQFISYQCRILRLEQRGKSLPFSTSHFEHLLLTGDFNLGTQCKGIFMLYMLIEM